MNNYFIAIIALCCVSLTLAQRPVSLMVMTNSTMLPYACMDLSDCKVIDTSHTVLTYRLTTIYDTIQTNSSFDNIIVEIGTKKVKCFGQRRYLHNWGYTTLLYGKKKSMTIPELNNAGEGRVAYELFFDNAEQTLTYFNELPGWYSKRICYQEKRPKIAWQIGCVSDSILGFRCHEAIGQYAGRIWSVAFTTDIAIDAGPWKLCGLPGIILRAEDSQKQYRFDCISMKRDYKPMYIYNIPTDKITRTKWIKMEQAMCESPYFYFSNGGKAILSSSTGDLDSSWTIPYNPIERE